jgi:ribonucleoside-diphosphate reductase alpha chain
MQKYAKKYSKTKFLELPQHRYMAVAIQLHYKDKNRMETIKRKYDDLSLHRFTAPTPMIVNSLERVFNPTSCVLIEVEDDSESILEVARSMGIYSKYGSGIGLDITRLRAIGAIVDLVGKTSGVINFIKLYESVISSFNQRGVRSGAAVINFAWWHYESPEIIMLKDAGGADEERARKLKYTIKWNRRFSKAIMNDEEVYLFDPLDTPELIEAYGDEFDKWYEYYSNKSGIRKRKIKARELAFLFAKVRSETGNVYWMSMDNINEQRVSPDVIKMVNLCVEIVNRTKPIKLIKDKLIKDSDNDEWINIRKYEGMIGICNLSSVNLIEWDKMTEDEKDKLAYSILLGMDNAFEVTNYKVRLGELFNRDLRSVGIGVNNYANLLASKGIKFTDDEALKFTHELFEDLTYHFIKQAIQLAKERGKYKKIERTSWEKGIFPWELSKLPKEYHFEMKKDWESLREELKLFGIRFENLFSIAPTQTSGLVINSTEGIEPIRQYKIIKEGTYTLPFLAPNLNKNRQYYELAWDIPTKRILELAAIRQKFLDQSQSVNTYYKNPESAFEIIYDIIEAEKLGLKSIYYMNTLKAETEQEVCESCSS